MTSSGGFVKDPTVEDEKRMPEAAEDFQKRREETKKKREMEELAKYFTLVVILVRTY